MPKLMRSALLTCALLFLAPSIALAAVTLTGIATLPVVYALAALGGLVLVFDAPGRQTLTFQMVGQSELQNAVALNSGLFNASRVVGPALAGLVIAAVGTGMCFVVNAVSFLSVLVSLRLMREDELFPVCQERGIAVIARVPFDEGSLTGNLTADSRWPEGDFRNLYFHPENLRETLPRVNRLKPVVPEGMTMPQMVLRHILDHPAVTTVIPGMRKLNHVEQNIGVSDGVRLPAGLVQELKRHRWNRTVDWE